MATKLKPMPTGGRRLKASAQLWKPERYMKKAVKFMVERDQAGLLLDPGLRKTSITLAAIQIMRKAEIFKGALIVAPRRPMYGVWPKEIAKWTNFNDLSYGILHGPKKEEVAKQRHHIYLINYEGLDWLIKNNVLQFLLSRGFVDTLVFDELSKMKHTNTKRFKLLKPFLSRFTRRYGLTGSPASNGLMNLFGQCFVLDSGRALGQFITHFRMEFFVPQGMYDFRLKTGAEQLIYDRVGPLMLRMEAEDHIKLPKVIPNDIKIELPPKVRAVYKRFEDELYAALEDGAEITAPSAAVMVAKCKQICNGAIYKDDIDPVTGLSLRGGGKRLFTWLHDEKLDALEELIDELQGQQLLVAYEFRHDLERIQERFKHLGRGKTFPFIGGGTTDARADELQDQWNAGELPVLWGHPASIGHGLNLQEGSAHNVCFFGLTWDFELYDQFIRRLRRSGNRAAAVIVHHIVVERSVDIDVLRAWNNKARTQKDLSLALKKYRH